MSSRLWYKRFSGDFISSTALLTFEQKGAYSLLLDLMYLRGESIPDQPQEISKIIGVSVRKWKGLRADLIAAGKIYEKEGNLNNDRVSRELLLPRVERMCAHTKALRNLRNLRNRISPLGDLTHRVLFKLVTENGFAYVALLASNLGNKVSRKLGAIHKTSMTSYGHTTQHRENASDFTHPWKPSLNLWVLHLKFESSVIQKTLCSLRLFSRGYFVREEETMRDIGFPELEDHRSQHGLLLSDLDLLNEELEGGQNHELSNKALKFLEHYLLHHILVEDKKIGQFSTSST